MMKKGIKSSRSYLLAALFGLMLLCSIAIGGAVGVQAENVTLELGKEVSGTVNGTGENTYVYTAAERGFYTVSVTPVAGYDGVLYECKTGMGNKGYSLTYDNGDYGSYCEPLKWNEGNSRLLLLKQSENLTVSVTKSVGENENVNNSAKYTVTVAKINDSDMGTITMSDTKGDFDQISSSGMYKLSRPYLSAAFSVNCTGDAKCLVYCDSYDGKGGYTLDAVDYYQGNANNEDGSGVEKFYYDTSKTYYVAFSGAGSLSIEKEENTVSSVQITKFESEDIISSDKTLSDSIGKMTIKLIYDTKVSAKESDTFENVEAYSRLDYAVGYGRSSLNSLGLNYSVTGTGSDGYLTAGTQSIKVSYLNGLAESTFDNITVYSRLQYVQLKNSKLELEKEYNTAVAGTLYVIEPTETNNYILNYAFDLIQEAPSGRNAWSIETMVYDENDTLVGRNWATDKGNNDEMTGINLQAGKKYCLELYVQPNTTFVTKTTYSFGINKNHTHTYGNWNVVTAATTTAKGLQTRECTVCKATESQEIPVLTDSKKENGANDSKTDGTSSSSVSAPAKVKKLSVKSASKQLTVTWKALSGVSGYQVQYSTKSNFKKATTKTLAKSKKKCVIKGLKSKKKYYVRVRAYKTYKDSNGKTQKVYGKWVKTDKKTK